MTVTDLTLVDEGLPRRLSVRKFDKNYDDRATALSDRIAVLLDGVELPEVAAWDVDAGEVIRIVRQSNGSPILDEQGLPAYEKLRGRVEVRWAKRGSSPRPGPGAAA